MCAKKDEWIREKILPRLSQILGKASCELLAISVPEDAFFSSDLTFVDIKFGDETLGVVIKKWPSQNYGPTYIIMATEFNNEILFYEHFAKRCNHNAFPRCYYTMDSLLVLENVRKSGFRMCPQFFNVRTEFVVAAMREIARFHSAGYALKKKQPEHLKKIISKIQETKYDNRKCARFEKFVNIVASRGIDALKKADYDAKFCDKMQFALDRGFRVIHDCFEPSEPLATLCHGDFLRNNVLYKELEEGEQRAMLVDFGAMRYATPAIDLAVFFHLSCSRDDRVHGFEEIFSVYSDTLRECLKELGFSNLEDFSGEALRKNYERNAIFGFIIATFFLPVMIYGNADLPNEDFYTKPIEECGRISRDIGGEKMTEILAEMLLDLRRLGCLDRFLE